MASRPRIYPPSSFAEAIPIASILCAAVDAGITLVVASGESARVRLEHLAYLAGHRLLIGALLWSVCTLYVRWAGAKFGSRSIANILVTMVVSALLLGLLFIPNFQRQWWPFATANLVATWLAYVSLPVFVRIEPFWVPLRFLPPVGFVVVCAHHFFLPHSLPETHIALTIFEICLLAVVLRGHFRFDGVRRRSRWIGWSVLATLGIVSAVIRPPFLAAAALAKDTGSVFSLLTWLYPTPEPGREAMGLVSDSQWFERRQPEPVASPSGPPLSLVHPTVVLFTIDALRYEVFATKRERVTPHLDALAKESFVFSHAYSTATSTAPSLSSIMSGHFFSEVNWENGFYPSHALAFPDAKARALPTFVNHLDDAHVTTFWAPAMGRLDEKWGIVRGFGEEAPAENGALKKGKDLSQEVLTWLARHRHESAFAFTHIIEPHAPYSGPGVTAYERYLGDVTSADTVLGDLIDAMRTQGMWDQTILIVSADHGEAFGEHDQLTHGGFVYDELVHVPLVIHVPPGIGGMVPRNVEEPVSLIDLGPTILELFGVPVPGDYQGQSLVPWLRGQDVRRSAPIAFDTPVESVSFARASRGILFRDGIKAMWSKHEWRFELYDLANDPSELHNLADEMPDASKRLGVLLDFFSAHEAR